MASQTLTTIIAINAQANGFGQVGATLTELGTLVSGLSQQLIDFGKESIDVYKDYEKSMHEAEVALSTSHGRNTKELAEAMDTLNAKATEWAATTIFHTDDVANAINQAAHAGWDLDQILNGIPVAMQLAQAGSLDLSDALTYITKSMSAFGVPYEELGDFIDMWVYAANSSVGDVQDFGDAMKKMGATMRFTDSKEELFALIGLMHDMGESGSTAATLLRTSMMRIIAPSGVASKVMEQLGATDDEIREIREDASKLAALKILEDYGFNAFKEDNQAKPMIQIYAELGEVLAEIAGGYENITKNKTTLGVLSTIFGMRGITGALDIVTALQNAVELRDKLLAGNATGYGEYAAETMMDTLYGKTEIFESKMERLKQVVGEELSGQVESVMESVGGIVDNIAEMDEGKFSALVSGLEVIAAAGPALLLAGAAFRLIGVLLTPAGGIGLGLVALAAAATSIEKLQQADLRSTFGDMEIDSKSITSYVHSLSEDFRTAYEYTDQFQDALGKAVANYRDASSTFGSNLFSVMIRNAKLSPGDLQDLLNMGQKMYEYAQEAVYTAASGDAEYWTQLFGGDEEALNDPLYQSIIEKTNAAYEANKSELEAIGENMRQTIMGAYMNDEKIDEDEYNQILEYFRQYNALVAKAAAQAADEENRVQMRKWLLQAQTGSFDDINELARTAAAERDSMVQKENDLYLDKKARLIENGGTQEELDAADRLHYERLNEIKTRYDEFQMSVWESQLSNNGQMDNWNYLKNLADQYIAGQLSTGEALNATKSKFGGSVYSGDAASWVTGNDRAQLAKITGYMLTAMGGEEEIQRKIDLYTQSGNTEMAERMTQLYAMYALANGFQHVTRTDPVSVLGWNIDLFGEYGTLSGNPAADKAEFESRYTSQNREIYLAQQKVIDLQAQIANAEGLLNGTINRPWNWYLMNGAEQQKLRLYGAKVLGEYQGGGLYDQLAAAEQQLAELLAQRNGTTEEPPNTEGIDGLNSSAGAAGAELKNTAGAAGNAADRISSVAAAAVTAATTLSSITIPTYLLGENYAEGGRATYASIFGEAGPEWAIPEEHSARTADLLNAARVASGFTWEELLARFGGLNGSARQNNNQTNIVYSPTIHASDASGVDRALREDKRRFEKWLEDKQMRDGAEVYA